MAVIGNTIRLRAEFRTFDGALTNPNQIYLTFYNYKHEPIFDKIPIPIDNAVEIGVFEYDYTIPNVLGSSLIYYEFSAISEGTPVVARGQIPIKWI